jgi:ATP-binding cassette subfamily B protein
MARYSAAPTTAGDEPAPVKLTGQSLREAASLFRYLSPYRTKFLAALLGLFLSASLLLSFPMIAGELVKRAIQKGPDGSATGDIHQVALLLLLVLGLQAFFSFWQSLWFSEVGERSLADLRGDAYARLIRLPMVFFAQRRVGELTSRVAADLALIQDTLIATLPHLIRQSLLLVAGVALIAWTSPRLTLIMLLALPVLIGIAAVFGRRIRKASHDAQDRLADSSVVVEETLQGVFNVKAFGNEGFEQARYQQHLQQFVNTALRSARARAAFISFIIFALLGTIVLVLWSGAMLVQSGNLNEGDLASFVLYTMFVAGAMGSLPEVYSQLQRAVGATARVREILGETPENLGTATEPARRIAGDVEFVGAQFRYPSRPDIQVLRNINLHARAGERVALVGPSGAGKSTLVSLLLRFYEPEAGRLLIDGRDARDYPLAELRAQMAVVPQEVMLFGGTIAENIAYGRPGASEAEIIDAARKANAHDFVMSFPEGYQTRVGERGIQLSGGQRQRVAIARAILRDPAILILDEATSSLDSESESLVQQALETLMHGRTSLIIAHRLATVRTADRIYVIKDGQTIESGKHAELIQRTDGVYRNLSELQFDLR